jgi:phosphohistidine phosphatase SixA
MEALRIRHAARGLPRVAPRPDVSRTSPQPRARATAEVAVRAFQDIEPTSEPLLADQGVERIVAVPNADPSEATVVIVGGVAMLGALLARMLGSMQAERLAFKERGAALVDLAGGPSAARRLIWFLDPRTLRTFANVSGAASTSPAGNGNDLREKTPS